MLSGLVAVVSENVSGVICSTDGGPNEQNKSVGINVVPMNGIHAVNHSYWISPAIMAEKAVARSNELGADAFFAQTIASGSDGLLGAFPHARQ
jgi:hypothetical protein